MGMSATESATNTGNMAGAAAGSNPEMTGMGAMAGARGPSRDAVHDLPGNLSAMDIADAVIVALNRQTANVWTLLHNIKKYHWQVHGPQFRSLHKFFDKAYEEADLALDELGERVRIFQKNPVFALDAIPQVATIPVSKPGFQTNRDICLEALQSLHQVIIDMRQDISTCEDNDDPGSADLLSGLVQVFEKQAWFLREFLHHDDLSPEAMGE
jgi:starvation-inducible DNA-binding protein